MNLLPQFSTIAVTSPQDKKFDNADGEEGFHTYFSYAKDRWIEDFMMANSFFNVNLVTHKYSVEIKNELTHPSILRISNSQASFERLKVQLVLVLESQDSLIAKAEFELIPVSLLERNTISKTMCMSNTKWA